MLAEISLKDGLRLMMEKFNIFATPLSFVYLRGYKKILENYQDTFNPDNHFFFIMLTTFDEDACSMQ